MRRSRRDRCGAAGGPVSDLRWGVGVGMSCDGLRGEAKELTVTAQVDVGERSCSGRARVGLWKELQC